MLLVDDDPNLLGMLRLGLIRLGYQVETASNGVEAARRLKERIPDVVLLDVVMPEKDGLETLIGLRRQGIKVKVIVMSGGGRVDSRDYLDMARVLGADGMLAKPFGLQDLDRALRAVLDKPG